MKAHTRAMAMMLLAAAFARTHAAAQVAPAEMARFVEKIPGTLVTFEMMPVPGGTVQMDGPGGPRSVEVAPFWIGRTEVTWDLYDVFAFALDRPATRRGDAQAVSRPTKPYVLPGESFGHEGMPALGMTFRAAHAFAHWLSVRTGRTYRVATEAEWEHACRLGLGGLDEEAARARAWHRENADGRTHAPASLPADALGVHDLLGNVAEWVRGMAGDSVIKGGAFDDTPARVTCAARRTQTPAWNATDPQLPKSQWWLPDAPFAGLRVVRER